MYKTRNFQEITLHLTTTSQELLDDELRVMITSEVLTNFVGTLQRKDILVNRVQTTFEWYITLIIPFKHQRHCVKKHCLPANAGRHSNSKYLVSFTTIFFLHLSSTSLGSAYSAVNLQSREPRLTVLSREPHLAQQRGAT